MKTDSSTPDLHYPAEQRLQDAITLTEEIVASARKSAELPLSAGFANTRIHQGRAVLHEAGRILDTLKGAKP